MSEYKTPKITFSKGFQRIMKPERKSLRDVLIESVSDIRTELDVGEIKKAESSLLGLHQFIALSTEEVDKDTVKLKRVV